VPLLGIVADAEKRFLRGRRGRGEVETVEEAMAQIRTSRCA
jgi:hypothetical protein